jgi:hypothetical protein
MNFEMNQLGPERDPCFILRHRWTIHGILDDSEAVAPLRVHVFRASHSDPWSERQRYSAGQGQDAEE